MSASFSTGLVNALAGYGSDSLMLSSGFSFDETLHKISSSENLFSSTTVGDTLCIKGSLGNNYTFTVTAVEPDGSFVTTAESVTTEASGQTIAIANFSGGSSLLELMQYGVIAIFPSTVPRPATADGAEGGSPIVKITEGAGPFTPGNTENGLFFNGAQNGVITKKVGVEWSGVPDADGVATWARFYDNKMVTGVSTAAKRIDLSCGFASGEMQLTSTQLVSGKKIIVTTGEMSVPKV